MKYLFFLLILFPVKAHCEDVQTLIEDARFLASDPSTAYGRVLNYSQMLNILNMGQKQAMTQSHCLQQSLTFNLVPGTTYYPLPANYLYIKRLTVGQQYIQQMTPAALDGRSRGWEAAGGYPTYYFINFASRNLVGFAPAPQVATDTAPVKVDYFIQSTDLVNPSDIPFNNIKELYEYHIALAYYAASMMTQMSGLQSKSTNYMTIFNNMVVSMGKSCYNLPNYNPSASAVP